MEKDGGDVRCQIWQDGVIVEFIGYSDFKNTLMHTVSKTKKK